MRGRLVFVVGAAVGYVLGARAGRKRYEQIKSGADKLWNSPAVQKRVEQVQHFVDDNAPEVRSKVTDSAKKVVDQVSKRAQRGGKSGSDASGSTGSGASGSGNGVTSGAAGGATGGATTTTGTTASGTTIPGSTDPAVGDRPPFE
jgi:hypothetical protein